MKLKFRRKLPRRFVESEVELLSGGIYGRLRMTRGSLPVFAQIKAAASSDENAPALFDSLCTVSGPAELSNELYNESSYSCPYYLSYFL
jgi:hypothetical protein